MSKAKRRARRKIVRDGCTGKKKYESNADARYAAQSLIRDRRGVRVASTYFCERCAHFHVSSKVKRGWWSKLEQVEGTA